MISKKNIRSSYIREEWLKNVNGQVRIYEIIAYSITNEYLPG